MTRPPPPAARAPAPRSRGSVPLAPGPLSSLGGVLLCHCTDDTAEMGFELEITMRGRVARRGDNRKSMQGPALTKGRRGRLGGPRGAALSAAPAGPLRRRAHPFLSGPAAAVARPAPARGGACVRARPAPAGPFGALFPVRLGRGGGLQTQLNSSRARGALRFRLSASAAAAGAGPTPSRHTGSAHPSLCRTRLALLIARTAPPRRTPLVPHQPLPRRKTNPADETLNHAVAPAVHAACPPRARGGQRRGLPWPRAPRQSASCLLAFLLPRPPGKCVFVSCA